jgi:hypothetical protein
MKKKTHKNRKSNKKGGDIDNRNGLKYILSIGYEMETSYFSKLTKTDVADDSDEIILYNTDTARADITTLKNVSENIEILETLSDEMISRMEETVEEDAYNDKNEVDKNIIFNITSDIADTLLAKKMSKICDEEADKNELYKFRSLSGEEYKINFIFKKEEGIVRLCETFSNVEWLFTYLKPEQSTNVVVNTFTNALANLVRHLSDLEEIEGHFILNTNEGEYIIDKPEIRTLYHKPNTNLYYLDTHFFDKKFTVDDICFKSQMTFSCDIENVILVMKTLTTDNYKTIPTIMEFSDVKLCVLNQIETCMNKLIDSYNEKEPTFKIIMDTRENSKIIKKVRGYLYLILYKLSMFYNDYLQVEKDKRKYFKDSLNFASRHDNNIFYSEIKKNLTQLFLPQLNQLYNGNEFEMNKKISEIIQRLVVQEDVLLKYFIDNGECYGGVPPKIRKNAFNPKNILEKNTSRYGDPEFSLISYFHFFENPTDLSHNITYIDDDEEGQIFTNEWFVLSQVDTKSARMELKNDIVLLEYRGFYRMLVNYLFNIADDELKNLMINGICNELTRKYTPDTGALSIKIAKRLLELKNARGGEKSNKNKTRKHRRSYKNKNKNVNKNKKY